MGVFRKIVRQSPGGGYISRGGPGGGSFSPRGGIVFYFFQNFRFVGVLCFILVFGFRNGLTSQVAEEKVRKRSLKDRLAEYKAGRHLGVPFNVEVREVDGAPVVHVNGNPEPELAISSRDRPDLNVSEALAEGAKSGDGGEFVLFRRAALDLPAYR